MAQVPNITSANLAVENNPYIGTDGELLLSPESVAETSQSIENDLNRLQSIQNQRPLDATEQSDLERALLSKQQLEQAVSYDTLIKNCFTRDTDKSWVFQETEDCVKLSNTVLLLWSEEQLNKERSGPDPCSESALAKISVELTRFFKTLKSIKKYGEFYVYGAINKIAKIRDLIASTSEIIAAVLKILVQRIRSWILELMRKQIEKVIDLIFNTIAQQIKDAVVDEVVKAIMCKFDEIIKGLSKLVTDFLFALLQNVVNPLFCAVEQFTNALINNLAAQIDRALEPILSAINDMLGGVVQVAGSVFQAIDVILGFEQFLCTAPDCPEITSYTGNDGPSQSEKDNFNNFLEVPDSGQVIGAASGWINNFSAFGVKVGDAPSIGLNCDTNPFRCGPPTVEIFGGGGIGAIANAVVNNVGQVIGVDLRYPGSGYTTPPYVTFNDTCGNGTNASAYSIINDEGQVVQIVMVNPGYGYLNSPSGVDEFGNPVVPGSNAATPGTGGGTTSTTLPDGTTGITTTYDGNPIPLPTEETKVNQYVACLNEIQVISTGIGYKSTDSIVVTPDIPNLQAGVKLTEEGQIIEIKLLTKPCGLSEIPTITINSQTGAGAVFRAVLSIQPVEEYDPLTDFDPAKLVQVIDCVKR